MKVVLTVVCVAALNACNKVKDFMEPTCAEMRFSHAETKIERVNFIRA